MGSGPIVFEWRTFEPSATQPDIGFDEGRADTFGLPEVGEPIACAVRDEERCCPRARKLGAGI
jgi:hypothetical protein